MSDDRAAVRDELDTSFVVEAGAGTGKTTTLLDRLANLLRTGRVPLEQVAAITFTDKAAGELKIRLRATLLADAQNAAEKGDARAEGFLDAALAELESAAITTIHSFCAAILKAYPFAAGLDPGFVVVDGPTATLLFDEVLDDWLAAALADPPAALADAVRAGLMPGRLRDLAVELRKRPDCPNLPDTRPVDPATFQREARAAIQRLKDAAAAGPAGDRAVLVVAELATHADDAPEPLAQAVLATPNATKLGAKGKWKKAVATLENDLRPELARLQELAAAFQGALDGNRLTGALQALRGMLDAYAAAKRERGWLDFDDLLGHTRTLLRDRPDICTTLAERYPVLLVDEVQDTDPIQAEIVALLLAAPRAEQPAAPAVLVGDPKQSLYRFRRADITLYNELADGVLAQTGGRRAALTQTWRNVPRLAAWVNRVCERVFAAGPAPPVQATWSPLESVVADVPDAPPPVVWLAVGGDAVPTKVDDRRELEAWRLAECLRDGVQGDTPWNVRDTSAPYAPRPLRFGDCAVLFRSLSALEIYEDTFRSAGVPFVVAGGRLFYRRAEVQALTVLATAIDDPGNAVAVVAVLKGPLVGCSDDDLFARVRAGGFDPLHPGEGPCAEPLAWIGEWHARRNTRPVAATLVEALERVRGWGLLRTLRNGAHRVANVEKLVDLARAQEQGGLLTFRGFTQFLRRFAVEQAGSEADSPVLEQAGDAVRFMTVHASKGLEFPVVALADLGPGRHTPHLHVIPVRADARIEVRTKVGERHWSTSGAEAAIAAEEHHRDAEERRAFYVACTRAKDRLVIPQVPQAEPTGFNRFLADAGDAVFEDAAVRNVGPLASGEVPEPPPPLRPDWTAGATHPIREERRAWLAGLSELLGPSRPVRPEPARAPEDGPALAIGRAVHGVLELIDLANPSDVEAACRAAAAAEGYPDQAADVQAMVERALGLSVTQRAANAKRCWRELPLFIEETDPNGSRIAERRPDLLFEEANGKLILADWKTDRELTPESERHYQTQLRRYAAALAAIGRPVAEAWLLLVRPGTQIPIDV